MAKKQTDEWSFDFSSLDFDYEPKKNQEAIPINRLNVEGVAFENAEKMVNSLDYSKDYFCFVAGSFIFGDFIEALIYQKELMPTAVYITTLGMSENNIDSIVNLVDYLGTQKVNLIVSHYFAGVERHKLIPYMEREFKNRPIDVAVLQSHAKIALIRSQNGDVAICGSANLSSSNNVEQFCILHSSPICEYIQSRLDEIMERFTVIRGLDGAKFDWHNNKNNTGKKAFDAIFGEN